MDQIWIQGLEVKTVIGVYDWERNILQTLLLDIVMDVSTARAAAGEDLAATADYDQISQQIIAWVQQAQCQLIETVAEGVAKLVLGHEAVAGVEVTVYKPGAVPQAKTVAVRIKRVA